MAIFLIIAGILLFTVQGLCFKKFTLSYMKSAKSYFLYSLFVCSVIFILQLFVPGKSGMPKMPTVVIGIIFGFIYIMAVFFYIMALEKGPLSFTVLLFSAGGVAIPVISGSIFLKEKMNVLNIVGFLLLFLAFIAGSVLKNANVKSDKKVTPLWFVFAFLAFLTNGSLGAIEAIHQDIMDGTQIGEFIQIGYFAAVIFSYALYIIFSKKFTFSLKELKDKIYWFITIVAGIVTMTGLNFIMSAVAYVPSVILFPVINGGIIVFTAIFSMIIFKEKIEKWDYAGMALGILAIVMLTV